MDPSSRPAADLLISGASTVITCVPQPEDSLGRITDGVVAIKGERIVGVGASNAVANLVDVSHATTVEANGGVVAPGFVDPHTHLVFGGSRVDEYVAAVTGELEAFASRQTLTGIMATVAMTRASPLEELTKTAAARLRGMFAHGTTTVESKTGYGLTVEDEMKMLEVNRVLATEQPVDIVSTFLGAHAIPPGTSARVYTDLIVNEMIPRVTEQGLAMFCDVYCDQGYFDVEDSRRILEAGLVRGLKAKVHADAYSAIGAGQLAADLCATSADHLNYTDRRAMVKLAEHGVTGVVMPALDFAVGHPRPFDARAMLDCGMRVALATDLCPGCWVESQQLVIALAARLYGISPAVALRAATVDAAHALGLDDRGTLEPGKLADLQVWDVVSHEDLVYKLGRNAVTTVVKRGRVYTVSGENRY